MPTITLFIPEDIYNKMKEHEEVKWSVIVREAIKEYLEVLEGKDKISMSELRRLWGIRKTTSSVEVDEGIEKKMMTRKWERVF